MPKHVLVAEDDHDIMDLVLAILEDEGFQVSGAVGAETLDRARRLHPDLILLDYQMPGMDGITIAQRLKASPETAGIPIIAMTAAGRAPTICHEMDAAGCLGKPFDIDHLLDTCARLIHMTH
jgi:two-component system phosphate regulon response regulator PhoB